jgi:hypothetical protein
VWAGTPVLREEKVRRQRVRDQGTSAEWPGQGPGRRGRRVCTSLPVHKTIHSRRKNRVNVIPPFFGVMT